MGREIKFRAWDKKRKRYAKVIQTTNQGWKGYRDKTYITNGIMLFSRWVLSRFIIEQYTGLKDKNGKEIYEGDIIESTWNGDKAEVVWNDVEGEWEHYADFNTHSKYSGSVVIGNIHENPELLEDK